MKIVTVITQGKDISTSNVYVVPSDWEIGDQAILVGEAMFENDLIEQAHDYLTATGKVTILSEILPE